METLSIRDKEYLLETIRDVKDFPKPGIVFKDITTLLKDKEAFSFLMDHLEKRYREMELDFIAGIDSRGFIFGAALADRLGLGFVPIRKQGKLPYTTIGEKYALEYGFDEIEIHIDAFACEKERPEVLLIDDLIATGGTANAAVNLINKSGAHCKEACFILELSFLRGAERLRETTSVYSVLEVT
ncbi:MAG: adenine phosphoribosyltransferase [Campylobacteraceae bacterium 4484_4]|nr:MAG: adenine phosphoribosyltransferase [Campylobacteraceae bacterium 4484_4]